MVTERTTALTFPMFAVTVAAAAATKITVPLTPEEIDQVAAGTEAHRPPGTRSTPPTDLCGVPS